ncbi:MAG: glycosyl hydrolase [Candidatus Coatesbacteria bacterium]
MTPKKGVGHWGGRIPAAPDLLDCSWYYNWGPRPDPGATATRAEFVPMIWSGGHATDENLAHVKSAGYRTLLAFNEPDGKGQADMTVTQALDLWPRLEATGLRLGSPGTTTGAPWLDEFMAGAKTRALRVDILCLHWYGDITRPDPVGNLRRYLEGYWAKYRLPIWLTEYSGADFDYHLRATTVEDNARFARESQVLMESLAFVERYAWFAPLVSTSDKSYPTVRMMTPEGALTPVGLAWVSAPQG